MEAYDLGDESRIGCIWYGMRTLRSAIRIVHRMFMNTYIPDRSGRRGDRSPSTLDRVLQDSHERVRRQPWRSMHSMGPGTRRHWTTTSSRTTRRTWRTSAQRTPAQNGMYRGRAHASEMWGV